MGEAFVHVLHRRSPSVGDSAGPWGLVFLFLLQFNELGSRDGASFTMLEGERDVPGGQGEGKWEGS